MTFRLLDLSALLLAGLGSACGESGEQAGQVVQAASKAAAETAQQMAEHLDLAQLTPEVAKAKVQGLLDKAAVELAAVKNSATAEKLGQLRQNLGQKLDLQALQKTLLDLIERFKHDPRVTGTLKTLQEKLQTLSR